MFKTYGKQKIFENLYFVNKFDFPKQIFESLKY